MKHPLVKVAQWKARGLHGGIVVPLRRVSAIQRWHVKVRVLQPSQASGVDQRDVLEFDADAPCSIREMHAAVMSQLPEIVKDGQFVHDAEFGFYIRARAH